MDDYKTISLDALKSSIYQIKYFSTHIKILYLQYHRTNNDDFRKSLIMYISHSFSEHSGPSFKKWRTSQAGAASQKSDVTEPVSATVCRKKIEDNRVERVVDILSKLVERLKI